MSKIFRQGDVLLRRLDDKVPTEGELVKDRVLARGEVTGHSHRMTGDSKVVRTGTGQLLVMVQKPAELVHEEHGHITIPEGVYEVNIQREYNPVQERQVTD